jgi:hypothetical protein
MSADPSAAQKALHAACIVVSITAGKTAVEVAAEVASRAIAALRSKTSNPSRP